jgi:hypothetical protein
MAGLFTIDIEALGLEAAETLLDRVAMAVGDLRPAFDDITRDFNDLIARRFAAEGPGWAPLTEPYAAWKARVYGTPILVRTGAMKEAILSAEVEVAPDELRIATDAVPFRFHQEGTRKMAQRKIVDLSDQDVDRWVDIVERYLIAALD